MQNRRKRKKNNNSDGYIRYGLNLRHVLDMETSNLRLSCIETHHSDARGTYSYDSQPFNLRMKTHRNRPVSDPAEISESEFTSTQYVIASP